MKDKKSIFLPKGTTGKYKNIMILHIEGIALVIVLMVLLYTAIGVMGRSVFSILFDMVNMNGLMDSFNEIFEIMGYSGVNGILGGTFGVFKVLSGIIIYGGAFISLIGTIVVFILMKKRIAMINEDEGEQIDVAKVKKAPYVWLGFLLGAFGGHLFVMKKKKAWIFLVLGIFGMWFFPAFIYTTAISFSDALLAAYTWKDHNGYVEIEDYPYWL